MTTHDEEKRPAIDAVIARRLVQDEPGVGARRRLVVDTEYTELPGKRAHR